MKLLIALMTLILVTALERSGVLMYCMTKGHPLRQVGLTIYRRGRYVDGWESRGHDTPLVAIGFDGELKEVHGAETLIIDYSHTDQPDVSDVVVNEDLKMWTVYLAKKSNIITIQDLESTVFFNITAMTFDGIDGTVTLVGSQSPLPTVYDFLPARYTFKHCKLNEWEMEKVAHDLLVH
jgi:hypothetical protein